MKPKNSLKSLLIVLLQCLTCKILLAQGTPVYHGESQTINTSTVTNRIEDYTEHTYGTLVGAIGYESTCFITRTFSAPIKRVSLILEKGCASDVGYVGGPS